MNIVRYILFFLSGFVLLHKLQAQPFYEVAPLSINTSYADEVAAVPYGDGLIYCSNRNMNVIVSRTDSKDEHLFHLFYVPRKDSIHWGNPYILDKNLTPYAHQGPCSVSANGNEIYFTLNSKEGNGIYSATKEGDHWSNVRPFVHNSPAYRTAHPSLSRDGKRLFFASDMPGGQGGFDIYCCEWTPRGWGEPVNLGPEVNTSSDELYPFIQENNILYFSSYGHQSMGGLDIFSVREINGTWGLLQYLEAPVNSEYDDFAYVASDAEGMDGYFSTDRGGKNVDIFSFKSLFPYFAEYKEQEENDYTYIFDDPGTIDLDSTTFIYEWDLGDGTRKRGKEVEHTFASTGHYIIQLNVIDSLTGEFTKQAAIYDDFYVLDIEQPYMTITGTFEAGKSLSLSATKTYLPQMDIDGYYWILGDGTRVKGENIEHIFAAPGEYQIQLGVTGKSKETGEEMKVSSSRTITIR